MYIVRMYVFSSSLVRVFRSSVFNGLWERQCENCLSWPEFVKASVEKAVLTKEHRLQGLLRCQRENSCREYFVTQEEWGSLPWQQRAVDSPCGAGWLGGHGPAKLPVGQAAWRLFFLWRYSGQAHLHCLKPGTGVCGDSQEAVEEATCREKN